MLLNQCGTDLQSCIWTHQGKASTLRALKVARESFGVNAVGAKNVNTKSIVTGLEIESLHPNALVAISFTSNVPEPGKT